AANAIYQFVWSRFCDWYLELIKPVFSGEERGAIDDESKKVAGWVLDQILVLLHPFMPFITEELWHALADPAHPRENDLIVAKWPMADARAIDPEASREIDWLIRLVGEVRGARTELNVPPGARLAAHVRDASAETKARLASQATVIARLARIDIAEGEASGGALQVVVDEATFVLPLEGVIDLDAERTRLTKAIAAAEKERDGLAGRLDNPSFVERAKPEAVEKARADHAEKVAEAERLTAALSRLG
ncbi:MAG TPA: class I tRNA ligase family protein, partial [Sphingomonas sp.]|nr:class I tRNA ligase family protein [Sphingomonas sp.]